MIGSADPSWRRYLYFESQQELQFVA